MHSYSYVPGIYIILLSVDVREAVGDRTNRDYFDSCATRRLFLTKINIKNIQTKVNDFSIKRHQNDATSVDLIVEELKNEPYNPVLIYRPQGRTEPHYPMLQDKTFVLALQTKFQRICMRHMHPPFCVLIQLMVQINTGSS